MTSIAASSPTLANLVEKPTETPQRIVAIAFDSPIRAQEALLSAMRLQEQGLLSVHDAVFVAREHAADQKSERPRDERSDERSEQ